MTEELRPGDRVRVMDCPIGVCQGSVGVLEDIDELHRIYHVALDQPAYSEDYPEGMDTCSADAVDRLGKDEHGN